MTQSIKRIAYMEQGALEMSGMPTGYVMTIITAGDPMQGEYYVKVYKKVDRLHVRLIDSGWRN